MFSGIVSWAQGPEQKRENARVQVMNALDVVNCRQGGEDLKGGYSACLEARFIPNQRLIRVFGINNAFTTKDEVRAKIFRDEATGKIRAVTDKDRKQYVNLSLESAFAKIEEAGEELNLADLVQSVTLEVSLNFLFGLNTAVTAAADNISFVAKEINRLWQASKTASENTDVKWEDQGKLHKALHALLDNSGVTSSDDPGLSISERNPMNWILPAYETMWRIVLRGLIEVRFRGATQEQRHEGWLPTLNSLWRAIVRGLNIYLYGEAEDEQQAWLQALDSFVEDPNQSTVPKTDEPVKVSARHIALECLRLYPPTRRIDRQFPYTDTASKADIEGCQRLPLLAQDRPLTFLPRRWINIEDEFDGSLPSSSKAHRLLQKKGFMPFGAGKFQCPADMTGFGWKMVALLVGTLSRSLDGDWKVVEGELPPVGQPLESGREGCLELVVGRG